MTWTKLPDDFSERAAGLSDAAVRTHIDGLVWAMRRLTGGRLTERDIRRGCESQQVEAAVAELVAAGWWRRDPGGWLIVETMEHQPEPEVVEARRQAAAERQRRHRRRKAKIDSDPETAEQGPGESTPVTRDRPRDATRDSGRVGSGRVGDVAVRGRPDSRACVAVGCDRPPRRGCWTCAEHMAQEPVAARGGRS